MGDAEKRSIHTDALGTLGNIIDESEKRDAIHLAVNPTQAQVKLYPGQDVGTDGTPTSPVGIVDPFLKNPVQPGQWFWLIVYPRQITSLRHVWSHPSFPDSPSVVDVKRKENSELWLRDFCNSTGDIPDYERLLRWALMGFTDSDNNYREDAIVLDGEQLISYGTDASGSIPPAFWDHLEDVTGRKFTERATYFSCSC